MGWIESGWAKPIPAGTKFGKWTVIGPDQTRYRWICRCECGMEKSIGGATLRNGTSSKCKACASRDRGGRPYRDVSGKRFGRWLVMDRIPIDARGSDPNQVWRCRCECGTEKHLSMTELRRRGGCFYCAKKGPAPTLRPYEAVYKLAKHVITNRVSRTRQHDFTISYEEFVAICETGKCHYCHTPLAWAKSTKHGKANYAYRMDRKNNSLGYVSGNVVGCCTRCNYAKGDRYSYEQWLAMTYPYRNGSLSHPDPYIRNRIKSA